MSRETEWVTTWQVVCLIGGVAVAKAFGWSETEFPELLGVSAVGIAGAVIGNRVAHLTLRLMDRRAAR